MRVSPKPAPAQLAIAAPTNCFCGRLSRGFAWQDPYSRNAPRICACSMACMAVIQRRRGNMMPPPSLNNDECNAVISASPLIGAHLEKLGKTDMAAMTEEEWLDFVAATYSLVCVETRRVWEKDVPF